MSDQKMSLATPPNEDDTVMIPAERASWVIFGVAVLVTVIAGFIYIDQLGRYSGDPTMAAGWMTLGSSTAGLVLVPALILSGIRQLLPRLRSVSRRQQIADAENRSAE